MWEGKFSEINGIASSSSGWKNIGGDVLSSRLQRSACICCMVSDQTPDGYVPELNTSSSSLEDR